MQYLNGGYLFSLLRNLGCLEEDMARVYIAELVSCLYLYRITEYFQHAAILGSNASMLGSCIGVFAFFKRHP